jgi:Sortase domain
VLVGSAVAGISAAVVLHRPSHLVPLTVHVPIDIGTVPTAEPRAPRSSPRTTAPPPAAPVLPSRLRIARLGVDSAVVPVVVDPTGALGVPRDPHVIGWWADGAKPGAVRGTAILDGHVNYAGVEGSLAHLERLRPGDPIELDGTAGGKPVRLRFTVTGTRSYSKHALPAAEVFDQRSVGRLVLVTCGGPFNASSGNYEDNILTYAMLDSRGA